MKQKAGKYILFTLIAAAAVLLDRLTKVWAVGTLKGKDAIVLIEGVFEFRYLENNGMAFGLLQNQQVFFYITTAVILAAVLYLLYRTPMNKRFLAMLITLACMTGGAVGNLIDRISTKYVVDFLYFSLINFPIFNVADSFVTLSTFALFILLVFVYKDEEFSAVYGLKKKDVKAEEGEKKETLTGEKAEEALSEEAEAEESTAEAEQEDTTAETAPEEETESAEADPQDEASAAEAVSDEITDEAPAEETEEK